MEINVTINKGEKYFIARIPEFGITTQGITREEAKENLKEAVQLHFESLIEYLAERNGIKFENNHIVNLEN